MKGNLAVAKNGLVTGLDYDFSTNIDDFSTNNDDFSTMNFSTIF